MLHRIVGWVNESGGGEISIRVDRDLMRYPEIGTLVSFDVDIPLPEPEWEPTQKQVINYMNQCEFGMSYFAAAKQLKRAHRILNEGE